MKLLFIFIDGVGMRPPAADNPVRPEVSPTLCRLMAEHAVPVDTCLGVSGLPQSATGQTVIFTGTNAPAVMGRHCEGFPGPSLRKIIEDENILMALMRQGFHCRFADAYLIDHPDDLRARRFKSVTTVMALTRPEVISMREDLMEGAALSHDITGEVLHEKNPEVPTVQPAEGARRLVQMARANDFTLFEFFLTDVAGHSRSLETAEKTLRTLDEFLAALLPLCEESGILTVMVSDHGNIEDMSAHGHTCNPVPLIAVGPRSEEFLAGAKSLLDVYPRVLRMMGAS